MASGPYPVLSSPILILECQYLNDQATMSTTQPWSLPTITVAESHLQSPSFTPFTLCNLINGSFAPRPSEAYIDSYNPKTGQLCARVCDTSTEQVNEAVEAADRAFASWSATPPSTRSKYLLRIADLINEQKELFAVWESIDQGKTLARARAEVDRAVSNFRYHNHSSLLLSIGKSGLRIE